MSHGVQVGCRTPTRTRWTSRAALGLFYNGNNPLNLRDGYASADFDRTHVLNFSYVFQLPDFWSTIRQRWKAISRTDGRWSG